MFGIKINKTKSKKGERLPLASDSKQSSASPSPKGKIPLKTPDKSSSKISIKKTDKESEFYYISNEAHYEQIIKKIKSVKKLLWIGTADIKDLYLKEGKNSVPLLQILSELVNRGVEIRLIHAKEPGPAFRQDFDKYPSLIDGMERVLCPRVHFKIVIFDLKTAYVGSANLTGAGMGMKSETTRNFEAGILSSNNKFVKQVIEHFDRVWMGAHCKSCKRKKFCGDPIE